MISRACKVTKEIAYLCRTGDAAPEGGEEEEVVAPLAVEKIVLAGVLIKAVLRIFTSPGLTNITRKRT